ncbi:MAG TPA: sensor domain-containing diguanylate cyclase [Rhodocyclaceae bacterium]|jgi:diguanylate cyclase (GGDEF)-like protein|nr:sensor domain-containing diguanylate cyclase [Rhodocyclaceae bacterium]
MNKLRTDPLPPLRDSLERKLIVALCVAALLFSVVAGAVQFAYSYQHELERSRSALDNLAATVHSSAAIAAFVGNDAIANDVIEGLLRNADILAVNIESDTGYQMLRWKHPSAANWISEDLVGYQLMSPSGAHEQIGTLSLLTNAPLISLRARNAALGQLGMLVAQTLVIALIMLLAFRRLIGYPLSQLTRQLRTVTPGSSQRIDTDPSQKGTEIGLLAASLNHYLAASEDAIRAERELRLRVESMESHYRRIFESTNVGIMVLDTNGALVNCNTVLREGLLRPAFDNSGSADVQGDFLALAFRQPERAWALIERARTNGHIEEADLELCYGNGRSRWGHCLFSVHALEGNGAPLIECVLFDVTSRREREETAVRRAERDVLTDLINRRGAEAYLDRAIRDARRADLDLTVLYIDLDGFKNANDTYGHDAGDQALIEVAFRFGRCMRRASDLLARIGGDEFLIVTYDCNRDSAVVRELAERLIASLAVPISLSDGRSTVVGASIGIAGFPQDGADQETVLRVADRAMYVAKRGGKNRYVYAEAQHADDAAAP